MEKVDKRNLKIIAVPVLMLVVVLLLTAGVGVFAFREAMDTRDEIAELKRENKELQDIKDLLLTTRNKVEESAQQLETAFPSFNASAAVSYNIRQKAQEYNVAIRDLSIVEQPVRADREPKPYKEQNVKVSVTGSMDDMLAFVDDIRDTAPLLRISGIAFSESLDSAYFTVDANTYWAAKMTEISSGKVDNLTSREEALIFTLNSLEDPGITMRVDLEPEGPSERENPFSEPVEQSQEEN